MWFCITLSITIEKKRRFFAVKIATDKWTPEGKLFSIYLFFVRTKVIVIVINYIAM